MAKARSRYVCQECGSVFPKWSGRCDACEAWNSLVEEASPEAAPKGLGRGKGRTLGFVDLASHSPDTPRRTTAIAELDRVLGGGLVAGSAILIGGDPGIGKSTLLLQAACRLAAETDAVYVSGEEAVDQIRIAGDAPGPQRRAASPLPPPLACATSSPPSDQPDPPRLAIIDSIQTMYVDTLESAPGTVAQVRASAAELIRVAQTARHGTGAGRPRHQGRRDRRPPRAGAHGRHGALFRRRARPPVPKILRGVKNRFGPTDEIGVFEMTDAG